MKRRRPPTDVGLTLVELMITIVVASLVASSTFIFFAGQQRIYETQTKVLNVQQNLWAAVETLARYARASGTGMVGCVRADPDGAGAEIGADPPAGTVDAQGFPIVGANGPGLRAFMAGRGVVRIPPLWITNGGLNGPDTITVAFGNGTFGNWTDVELDGTMDVAKPTDPITVVAGMTSVFRSGEFILLLASGTAPPSNATAGFVGDRGCTLFQITGGNPVGNPIPHLSTTSTWNPPSDAAGAAMVPWQYRDNTPLLGTGDGAGIRHFGELNWVQFAITTAADGIPSLTMNRLDLGLGPQILAEGIEDLQIAFACDGNTDGALDEANPPSSTDEWLFNHKDDSVAAITCSRANAIRITLVARSLTPDSTLSGAAMNIRPAAEDRVAGAANDEFRHRVISTTVFPRN